MYTPYSCILAAFFLSTQVGFAAEHQLIESLKATEESRLTALNAGNIDAVIEIEGEAVGFGRASTTVRKRDVPSLRAGIARWLSGMDQFGIEITDSEYRVVGQTGLVLGTLVRREKPKDGPAVTRSLRYSATYVLQGDQWRMVQYHRSPMPTNLPQ